MEKKTIKIHLRPDGRVAYARACKARYPGSIPGPASINYKVYLNF